MAGGAGAQQPAPPPRPQQPAPYNGQSQPYYYPPAQPYPGQPQQQAPAGSTVQQRSDRETPRLHFRPPPADPAPRRRQAARRCRGRVEPERRGRVPDEPPDRAPRVPARARIEELIQRSQAASTSSSWSTTSWTRWRASSAREDPEPVSPMAIKLVRLSSNLRPEFARTLESG
jgi:hypothetical protein